MRIEMDEADGKPKTIERSLSQVSDLQKGLQQKGLVHQLLEARNVADTTNPRYTYMLLFLMTIIILWAGCNNAAKEIVKEEAIYARERAVNLGIFPYLASKFLVMSLLTIFQTAVLMLLVFGTMHLEPVMHL